MESAEEFIARKSRDWEVQRDRILRMKDIGRDGQHHWLREAWTWLPQSNLPQKVFVVERLKMVAQEGQRAYPGGGAQVGDVEYRFGYFIVGRIGRAAGRWTWGQYSPMIPERDLAALLTKARTEGTIPPDRALRAPEIRRRILGDDRAEPRVGPG